jgi:hypothetical protein
MKNILFKTLIVNFDGKKLCYNVIHCTPKEIYVEIIKMSSPSQNNPILIKFSRYTCHAYAYGL